MPETVLEETENAVVHPLLDFPRQHLPQRAVNAGARPLRLVEQERKIDEAELRNPVGQIAARLIAEREQPVLDQPQYVLGLVAEIHDVPDVFYLDAVAEAGHQPVADALQCAAEARRRRSITAHANLRPFAH